MSGTGRGMGRDASPDGFHPPFAAPLGMHTLVDVWGKQGRRRYWSGWLWPHYLCLVLSTPWEAWLEEILCGAQRDHPVPAEGERLPLCPYP